MKGLTVFSALLLVLIGTHSAAADCATGPSFYGRHGGNIGPRSSRGKLIIAAWESQCGKKYVIPESFRGSPPTSEELRARRHR
jgi:hypothetical protein